LNWASAVSYIPNRNPPRASRTPVTKTRVGFAARIFSGSVENQIERLNTKEFTETLDVAAASVWLSLMNSTTKEI
jgi:hypothetical protein